MGGDRENTRIGRRQLAHLSENLTGRRRSSGLHVCAQRRARRPSSPVVTCARSAHSWLRVDHWRWMRSLWLQKSFFELCIVERATPICVKAVEERLNELAADPSSSTFEPVLGGVQPEALQGAAELGDVNQAGAVSVKVCERLAKRSPFASMIARSCHDGLAEFPLQPGHLSSGHLTCWWCGGQLKLVLSHAFTWSVNKVLSHA
jgi:hypothetical protein